MIQLPLKKARLELLLCTLRHVQHEVQTPPNLVLWLDPRPVFLGIVLPCSNGM
jgi:hypothetical protein